MVYKQVFPDADETLGGSIHGPENWQSCPNKCINRFLFGDVKPKVLWNGTICKEKPNNKWTADVYVDFVVLSDVEDGAWPHEASEEMSEEVGGIIQLRTVLQLHKQHCSICEDDIQAQQALLKQDKGAARAVPCIRKVFITPGWYEEIQAKLQRWHPQGASMKEP
ncbi:hypothetical protein WJX75_002890 [Coccomyxa subellipsoidea]|uniref:Uncharacterized protein n=1 Tax=Coccomyxa subellipsoidea TaxID=248742 RepID=A0ABR2YMJ3_9CHLO